MKRTGSLSLNRVSLIGYQRKRLGNAKAGTEQEDDLMAHVKLTPDLARYGLAVVREGSRSLIARYSESSYDIRDCPPYLVAPLL